MASITIRTVDDVLKSRLRTSRGHKLAVIEPKNGQSVTRRRIGQDREDVGFQARL